MCVRGNENVVGRVELEGYIVNWLRAVGRGKQSSLGEGRNQCVR